MRTKIMGIVLALVVLLGVGITVQVRGVLSQALKQRLQEQSVSVARDVAARATDLILINDLFPLHQLLVETQVNNPDVRYAFGPGFPRDLLTVNSVQPSDHHQTVLLESDEGPVWDTAVPIFDGQAGVARVGLSEESMLATVAALNDAGLWANLSEREQEVLRLVALVRFALANELLE